jgi:hypothetical protein
MVVVVICTAIIAVLLLSYLNMLNNSNVLTARSLAWNNALPVAEAGIEEATSAIQSANGQQLCMVLATNGWSASGYSVSKTRAVSNGYFGVLITATNTAVPIGPLNPPVIYSTGYVHAPLRSDYIGRTVRVNTSLTSPIFRGMLAKTTINMGGGTFADSFDSSNPTYSTGGLYDPAKAHDQVHVGCNSFVPNCITIGTAKVYGYLHTMFGGSPALNNGVVGDTAFVNNPANVGLIEVGHLFNNLNAVFQDAQVPYTSGASLYPGTVGGTNYTYVAYGSNYYYNGSMVLSGAKVLIIGNATIYVTGSFKLTGGSQIIISPGSTLNLVVGGPVCSISGGGRLNGNLNAASCTIQCLPGCTQGDFSGGTWFIGVLNAPEADFNITGGGGVCGALTAQSFSLTGGSSFHFDENLGTNTTGSVCTIISWAEL